MKVVLFLVGIVLKCFFDIVFGKFFILIFFILSLIFVNYLKIYKSLNSRFVYFKIKNNRLVWRNKNMEY